MLNFATLNFDTHKVVKLLQEKGFTEEQAVGFMTAMQEISLSGVATQDDIQDLRIATHAQIKEVREEIQNLKEEVQQGLHNLEIKMLKYIFANTVTLIAVIVAFAKVF